MKISIKTTNIKTSPSLNEYLQDKIGGLEKFLTEKDRLIAQARIEVGQPSLHHRRGDVCYAEVNLKIHGNLLRAQASAENIYKAIDRVKSELKRKIKNTKEKKLVQGQRRGRSFKKKTSLSEASRFRQK